MNDSVDDTDDHSDDEGDIDGVGDDALDPGEVFDVDRDFHRVGDVGIVEGIIVRISESRPYSLIVASLATLIW